MFIYCERRFIWQWLSTVHAKKPFPWVLLGDSVLIHLKTLGRTVYKTIQMRITKIVIALLVIGPDSWNITRWETANKIGRGPSRSHGTWEEKYSPLSPKSAGPRSTSSACVSEHTRTLARDVLGLGESREIMS